MLYTKFLSSIIDEVLTSSSCSPHVTSILREVFHTHYVNSTLMITDDYPQVIDALYGMQDSKMYSVIALCFVDEYTLFLMLTENVLAKKAMKEIVIRIKNETILTNKELGEVITHVHIIKATLQIILKSSVRTTRQAVEGKKPLPIPILPSIPELKRFYECERKTQYLSQEEAKSSLTGNNKAYDCIQCGHIHQGQKPTGMVVPPHIMEGRYKTAWRRYHGI